jgi:hypothetical protein
MGLFEKQRAKEYLGDLKTVTDGVDQKYTCARKA